MLIKHFGNEKFEWFIDVHTFEEEERKSVMFITITKIDVDRLEELDGEYTIVLNGIPTVKILKRIFAADYEAAAIAIQSLKNDALKYAQLYWRFDDGEWEGRLEHILSEYTKYGKRMTKRV